MSDRARRAVNPVWAKSGHERGGAGRGVGLSEHVGDSLCMQSRVRLHRPSTWAAGLAMDGSAEWNRLQAKKRESGQPLVPFGRFGRAE